MLTNILRRGGKVSRILPIVKDKGTYFKLSHLLVFIYRASIFSFHYNRSKEFVQEYKDAGNIKKLLYFLRYMEINNIYRKESRETQAENYFKISRGIKNYTLIPPDEVLFKYLSRKDRLKVERQSSGEYFTQEKYQKKVRSKSQQPLSPSNDFDHNLGSKSSRKSNFGMKNTNNENRL